MSSWSNCMTFDAFRVLPCSLRCLWGSVLWCFQAAELQTLSGDATDPFFWAAAVVRGPSLYPGECWSSTWGRGRLTLMVMCCRGRLRTVAAGSPSGSGGSFIRSWISSAGHCSFVSIRVFLTARRSLTPRSHSRCSRLQNIHHALPASCCSHSQ